MPTITNPILPGFHPDPSALRVGDDFFVATSTFEWWPGVTIHRSTDLKTWALAARPLDRVSQLDLRGVPASGGIWAPNLTWHDGLFWLVYTDVKNLYAPAKDLHNWLVTAPSVEGPWSEPVYLNASGFDPAFFHDDGRHWLINLNWDYRTGRNRFGGIVAQEFDAVSRTLSGPINTIYPAKGLREGSNLYKKDGWYYLMVAEGGTGTEHAAALARSRSVLGPYEDDPSYLFLTSRFDPAHPLQKAGHASLVEDRQGRWWLFHLAGRPIASQGKYPLGRETCLQAVRWTKEGWLRLDHEGVLPSVTVPLPDLPPTVLRPHERPSAGDHFEDFDAPGLDPRFLSLRVPLDSDTLTLTERPGWLRLKGRESLASRFHQALVARRWQSFRFTSTTVIDAAPSDFHHSAGLVCLYDHENWFYLTRTFDEGQGGGCLKVLASDNGQWTEEAVLPVPEGPLALRVDVDWDRLKFWWAPASGPNPGWTRLGRDFDASKLSDEHCREGWFTGAMVGLCCQDLSGRRRAADFDHFSYEER